MNKRIRKKKHIGEFTRYGFRMTMTHNWAHSDPDDWADADLFTDQLIDFAVANEMAVSGGGIGAESDYFVCGHKPKKHLLCRSRCCSLTERHRWVMAEWLAHHPTVLTYRVGGLVDLNSETGWDESLLAGNKLSGPEEMLDEQS